VCVCPDIRFHISQRILSKLGRNIIWVMTRIMGYLLYLRTQHARYRVRVKLARMCAFADLLLGTYYESSQVVWATYLLYLCTTHACERFPNLVKTFYLSPQVTWATYIHSPREPCVHACKHSFISGRILSRLGGNILQITTSCMG
jgi:hypothetical protein